MGRTLDGLCGGRGKSVAGYLPEQPSINVILFTHTEANKPNKIRQKQERILNKFS